AFPEQTRAPAIESETELDVPVIASGFRNPWAVAFLPDGRMLVTEKATGTLYVVTAVGEQTAVTGLPAVDARGQGGLLDGEVAADHAASGRVYCSYAEPRVVGFGLTGARGRLVDDGTPHVEIVQVFLRMMPTMEW